MTSPTRPDSRRFPRLLLSALAACSVLTSVQAAEMPKRKPGLWELNTHMEGMPSIGAMQQCIDRNSDDLMQQQAKKQKHNCSVLDIQTQGNTVTVHSVCKVEGSTATTDATFVGTFDSAYKGDMHTRFSPPMHGMSESKMSLDARWIGPCTPGQKPGDVIMPNMGGMNLNEMMKDPRIQQMMKQKQ
ncbi:DUF3617 domain-containing protein [Accumulibacter sp.]|uniref:DUF3617 domain-containing protein n=1 Tax=Accumulibacter sp. TaxID=2053492 RepID=UPI0028C43153|nr:DUF3617 family protein [Accumulibacter sp.]